MVQTSYLTQRDKRALVGIGSAFLLFAGFWGFGRITCYKNQSGERITSQQQLEQLVEEEKSKLSCELKIRSYIIDDAIVKTKLHGQCPLACSYEPNFDS